MNKMLTVSLCALLGLAGFASAQNTKGFDSMAQPEDSAVECKVPKPPRELAKSAYIRNGYKAIRRILAAEKWQETGDCSCFIDDFPWDEVVVQSDEFITGDDPLRPFDTSELRLRADKLEAERAQTCEGL